jgi:protein tyrosine/serine phosphatase
MMFSGMFSGIASLRKSAFVFAAAFAFVAIQIAAAQGAWASVQITNFSQVSAEIYRGGRPEDAASMADLKAMGIKTVIDLQGGDIGNSTFGWIAGLMEPGEAPSWIAYEKKTVEGLGMKFVNVPINSLDEMTSVSGYALGRAIALMNDPKNQPVYVHCEHGIDRTGMLIALYRVYYQNWTRQAAYDEMVEKGHTFMRQLITGDMSTFFWAATKGMP